MGFTTLHQISIEPATDDDRLICLTLIPEMAGDTIEHLVARRGDEIVGAAAIEWQDRRDLGGFPLDVHVVPWARRQGIGSALCAAAVALAHGETEGLWSMAAHEADTPAYRFLQHCGFVSARSYYFFSAALADYRDYIERSAGRVRARGPNDIEIMPLPLAPLDQVAWLITAHFSSSPLALHQDLVARAATDQLSRVAMRDGRVAGVLIVRPQDRSVASIDAWAVDPRDRRGSVSPLLLDASLAAGMAAGFTHFEFHCDDLTRDTMGAANIAAVLVARSDRLYKAA